MTKLTHFTNYISTFETASAELFKDPNEEFTSWWSSCRNARTARAREDGRTVTVPSTCCIWNPAWHQLSSSFIWAREEVMKWYFCSFQTWPSFLVRSWSGRSNWPEVIVMYRSWQVGSSPCFPPPCWVYWKAWSIPGTNMHVMWRLLWNNWLQQSCIFLCCYHTTVDSRVSGVWSAPGWWSVKCGVWSVDCSV